MRELETNEEAAIVNLLAIDHLAVHGSFLARWSNLCQDAQLPGVAGAHTKSVIADVIDVGSFAPFRTQRIYRGEPHGDNNGKPSFFPSAQACISIHVADANAGRASHVGLDPTDRAGGR